MTKRTRSNQTLVDTLVQLSTHTYNSAIFDHIISEFPKLGKDVFKKAAEATFQAAQEQLDEKVQAALHENTIQLINALDKDFSELMFEHAFALADKGDMKNALKYIDHTGYSFRDQENPQRRERFRHLSKRTGEFLDQFVNYVSTARNDRQPEMPWNLGRNIGVIAPRRTVEKTTTALFNTYKSISNKEHTIKFAIESQHQPFKLPYAILHEAITADALPWTSRNETFAFIERTGHRLKKDDCLTLLEKHIRSEQIIEIADLADLAEEWHVTDFIPMTTKTFSEYNRIDTENLRKITEIASYVVGRLRFRKGVEEKSISDIKEGTYMIAKASSSRATQEYTRAIEKYVLAGEKITNRMFYREIHDDVQGTLGNHYFEKSHLEPLLEYAYKKAQREPSRENYAIAVSIGFLSKDEEMIQKLIAFNTPKEREKDINKAFVEHLKNTNNIQGYIEFLKQDPERKYS